HTRGGGGPRGGHADTGRGLEAERAGGNEGDLLEWAPGAEPHDGALPELPLDLGDCEVESLSPVALPFRHRVLPSEKCLSGILGKPARRRQCLKRETVLRRSVSGGTATSPAGAAGCSAPRR